MLKGFNIEQERIRSNTYSPPVEKRQIIRERFQMYIPSAAEHLRKERQIWWATNPKAAEKQISYEKMDFKRLCKQRTSKVLKNRAARLSRGD